MLPVAGKRAGCRDKEPPATTIGLAFEKTGINNRWSGYFKISEKSEKIGPVLESTGKN